MKATLTPPRSGVLLAILVAVTVLNVPSTFAGTINGSFSAVAAGSNVDLSAVGKLDWVHWGLYTMTSVNRKMGVTNAISDFSILGLGEVYIYQYADNYNGYTWYDGWPVSSVTNTTTGVWAYQAFPPTFNGSGFQLTAPADTNWKQLQVFVGTFAAQGEFNATLSDGGAGYMDTSLSNAANGPGGVYTLDYKANSANQTLTVQWTLSQRALGTNSVTGNVTLQAAALTATNANNPPLVTLTNPVDLAIFAAPANIPMDAIAEDIDGAVTNVGFYSGTTLLGQLSSSPYSFVWSNAPIGHYFLSAEAMDNEGGTRFSLPVEVFVYGSGGSLAGSVATPAAAIDLTSEGSADWIHWGLLTNSSLDRKAGVPAQINGFTALGTNTIQQYADNFTSFAWNDGTPTPATNTSTGVFITGITNGFKLSLPADTTPRTARIYVGCYGAQGSFEAFLSDLSAAPYTDRSVSNVFGNDYAVYTLTYAAASAGQTLNVVYHTQNLFDFDYGNVTLQSASLQGLIPLAPFPITYAARTGSDFIMSFNTQTNHTYSAEYAVSLPSPGWTNFATVPGNGTFMTVTNYNVPSGQRFYRVQAQ